MKKITLALVIALSSFGASAQNFYNFTKLQQPYADLQNAVSINNGDVWDYDDFSEVTLPFAFSVLGQPVDRFLFDDDGFVLLGTGVDYGNDDEGMYYIYPSSIYIQDRTYSTGVSTSPISYKLEGTAGNRILKLEVKNAGLEDADVYGYDENHFYMNSQVWLYEADKSIEIHYGTNNITDIDNLTDGDGLFVGLTDDINFGAFVYGAIDNPSYGEFNEDTLTDNVVMEAYPADGTVYRFAPAQTAGLVGLKANAVSLYPNPATTVVNITSGNSLITNYTIIDTTGKTIITKNTPGTQSVNINVESLATGIYFIKVNNQHLKFIKN